MTDYTGDAVYAVPFTSGSTALGTPATVTASAGNAFHGPLFAAATSQGKVYVSDKDSSQVSVIAGGGSPQVSDVIPVGGTPEGVAVAPDDSKVYVAIYGTGTSSDGTIAVINTGNNTVTGTIGAGTAAYGIAVSPDGKTAYVTNNVAVGGTVTVIDLANGQVTATIPVGAKPAGIAITPDGKYVYVANSGGGTVSEIDTATNSVIGSALSVVPDPFSVAISRDGSEVYVSNYDLPGAGAPDSSNDLVSVIGDADSNTPSIEPTPVPLPLASAASGLAFAPDGKSALAVEAGNDAGYSGLCELYVPDGGGRPTACDSTPTGEAPFGSGDYLVGIAITPERDPTPSFTDTIGPPGTPSDFDASASYSPNGMSNATYEWNFGDGHTESDASATTTHTYAQPGDYTVTLTVTDSAGLSDQEIYTGQTASVGGAEHAVATRSAQVTATSFAYLVGAGNLEAYNLSTGAFGIQGTNVGNDEGGGFYLDPLASVAITPDGNTAWITDASGTNSQIIPVAVGPGGIGTQGAPVSDSGLGDNPSGSSGIPEDGIAIAPDGRTAYVANSGAQTVEVVNIAGGAPYQTQLVPLGATPYDVAVSTDGATVYVSTTDGVKILRTSDDTLVGTLLSGTVAGVAVGPDGKTLYAVVPGSQTAYAISTATNLTLKTFSVGSQPGAIAISPDGAKAWVVDEGNPGGGGVSELDVNPSSPNYGQVVAVSGAASNGLMGIAVAPDGSKVYVRSGLFEAVTPIDVTTESAGGVVTHLESDPDVDQYGIAISPDQAPTASFSATAGGVGSASSFDASASSSPVGGIASYAWNFGDGQTQTTTSPTVTHVYGTAGAYTVTLTVTNTAGTSTAASTVFTGQTVSREGGPSAQTTRTVTVAGPAGTGSATGTRPGGGTPSGCAKRMTTVTKTKGDQQLTLVVPAILSCPASGSLRPKLSWKTLKRGTKSKFVSATFVIDRGLKHVKTVKKHVKQHGKTVTKRVKVTSYAANATAKRLPASPTLSLKAFKRGTHTLKVVVHLKQIAASHPKKRHAEPAKAPTTKAVTVTLTVKFAVS